MLHELSGDVEVDVDRAFMPGSDVRQFLTTGNLSVSSKILASSAAVTSHTLQISS